MSTNGAQVWSLIETSADAETPDAPEKTATMQSLMESLQTFIFGHNTFFIGD